jgi:hypothetical protein
MQNSSTIEKQKAILEEFMKAQHNGFVYNIDIELKEKSGKIIYDPDAAMYRNNEWDYQAQITGDNYTQDLDNVPEYKTLYIRFADGVKHEAIMKIKEYISQKYQCRCAVYDGRITVFDF